MGRHSRKRNAPSESAPDAAHGEEHGRQDDMRTEVRAGPVIGRPRPGGPSAAPAPWPRRQRAPEQGAPRVRDGRPEPGGPSGTRSPADTGRNPVVGPPRSGPGQGPGPRKEYLDAFDDDVFGLGPPEDENASPGVPRSRAPSSQGLGPPRTGPDAPPPSPPGEEEGPGGARPDGPPEVAGTRGRTFTGVFAAAVTTVLAVVVAGQVTGAEQRGESGTPGPPAGAVRDGSSAGGPKQSDSPEPRPLTYAEKMARIRPLDPDLEGPGTFDVAVGGHRKGTGEGEVVRYRVDVEKGLPLDAEFFAEAVHRTVNDDRSWSHDGARSFERVGSGEEARFVITLASPGTTGVWCAKSGLDTTVRNVSCDSAATERIMINAWRWAQGSKTFGDERIREYREMLINHEVGHRLGRGHLYCESDGGTAPVMMQQTKTLTTGDRTCRPNAWPYPGQES